MRSIKIVLLVIVFLLIVDGVGVYYLVSQNTIKLNLGNGQNLNVVTATNENINLNEVVNDQNENLNAVTESQPTASACTTMDCLIALAKNCQIGEFNYAQTIPFPFEPLMTYNAVTYFKIKGQDADGACTFDQQNKTVLLSVTPDNMQKMIAEGKTQAEINDQLQLINDSYKAVADQVNQCTGTNENVAVYLDNVQKGIGGSSSCNFGVGEAGCMLEPDISCVMTKAQNHTNPDCSLSSLTAELTLAPGLGLSISATGFKDTGSQISWKISDSSIASISATNGESIMVTGINAGSTQLKFTDNAVGADCFVTIPVKVEPSDF